MTWKAGERAEKALLNDMLETLGHDDPDLWAMIHEAREAGKGSK